MERLNVARKVTKSPIPVIGIESGTESFSGDAGKYSRTAIGAYYKAEARGFESGHEIEDWLTAEMEVNQ